MNLDQHLEAILFAAARPLNLKRLAEATKTDFATVEQSLKSLASRLEASESAIMLQQHGQMYELVTRPEVSDSVACVVGDEVAGELSRPSLETLAILAYCGPLSRPELEQIRGVHSSMILRNLMLRGLVEEKEDTRLGQPTYVVTFDFLNHLGLPGVEALPEYQTLRGHAAIADVLRGLEPAKTESTPSLTL